ncbi:MAG: hypothetical protein ACJ0O0_01810 [Flavobacteriaceae bacterium]|jgi:hypothetical protein|nr:hypothetical protein [Flavobacteriales bacterium]MBA42279.1 hypothetical protein [Flavobacteriaceae bacterium]RCL68628.1 MAG: hypothetical protein DBW76_02900 [Bacteroidota bacterium]|tara:strand:+ start:1691 stop:1870 length:180 start_codon:yes stop_codon:yes gene_type:complete
MKVISIYLLIAGSLYLITKPYKNNIDQILNSIKLSTFDALWLSYVEGMAIGGIIMLIIS